MNNSIIDQIFRTGVVLLFIILAISCEKVKNLNNDYTGQVDTISDIEGNTYKTIGIGSQIWMAENLRVTRLNDGTIIPEEINDNTECNQEYVATVYSKQNAEFISNVMEDF